MIRKINFIAASLALGTFTGAAQAATYQTAVLADNPLYYWDMDTFTDGNVSNLGSAGNSIENQLGNQGAVGFVAGGTTGGGDSLGNAADFSGTSDRLLGGGQNGQNGLTGTALNQYVLEFWIKSSDGATNQYVMWHGPNNAPAVILGFNDNSLEAFSGSRTGADGPNITDSAWHHVVIGVDSTAGHIIYIDGALHSNQTESIGAWNSPANEGITLGGSNLGDPFNGQLDEFAVYEATAGTLAAVTADIADHYNAIPEPGSLALIAIGGTMLLRRRQS